MYCFNCNVDEKNVKIDKTAFRYMLKSLYFDAIGQVGKELFCVKKSILVTFSVPIISLCEVKTSVFIAVWESRDNPPFEEERKIK